MLIQCQNEYCQALYSRGTKDKQWHHASYEKGTSGNKTIGAVIPNDVCPMCKRKEE